MAVEKVYQPYDEQVYNSIPKQQPQTKPEKKTVSRKVVVQLTKFEKVFIHNFDYCNCYVKYLYAIFKNGCV